MENLRYFLLEVYLKTETSKNIITPLIMKTVEFRSSNGTLVVNMEGHVIPEKSELSDYLMDIVKVDLVEMLKFEKSIGNELFDWGSYDILNVGYWNKDGSYEEPCHEWRIEHKGKFKISVCEDDVTVSCPHCEHWEAQPIDQQRKHLQTFRILEWLPENEDDNELSRMECIPCGKEFTLEWDYDNLDTE